MAAKQVMRDLEKDLQCTLCLDRFQTPKMLPCLHTFCENCLEECHKQGRVANDPGRVTCPICRRPCELTNGVKGLQTNFHFVNLAEKVDLYKKLEPPEKKVRNSCGICDTQKKVEVFCIQCNLTICGNCRVQHARIPALKTHELLPLGRDGQSQLQTMKRKTDFHLCNLHSPEKLRFFCKTCFQLICRECTVVLHPKPEHHFVEAATEFDNVKATLSELIEYVGTFLQQTSKYIEVGAAGQEHLAMESRSLQKGITERHKAVKTLIGASLKKQMDLAMQAVQDNEQSKIAEVKSLIEKVQDWESRMKTAREMTAMVVKEGDMCSLLSMSNDLKNSLDGLREEFSELKWDKSAHNLEMQFVPHIFPVVELGSCVSTHREDLPALLYDNTCGRYFIKCEFDQTKSILNITKHCLNQAPMSEHLSSISITGEVPDNLELTACMDKGNMKLLVGLGKWILAIDYRQPNRPPIVLSIPNDFNASVIGILYDSGNSSTTMALVEDDKNHILCVSKIDPPLLAGLPGCNAANGSSHHKVSLLAVPRQPNNSQSSHRTDSSLGSPSQHSHSRVFGGTLKRVTISHPVKTVTAVLNKKSVLCTSMDDSGLVTLIWPETLHGYSMHVPKPQNLVNVAMMDILHAYSKGQYTVNDTNLNRMVSRSHLICVILWANTQDSSYTITTYDTKSALHGKVWHVPKESSRPRASYLSKDSHSGFGSAKLSLQICDISGEVFTCTSVR